MKPLPPHAPEVLVKGADILDSLGVKWWLDAGTLLGLHRGGEFIPHDTDLDVSVQGDTFPQEVMDAFDFPIVRVRPYQWAVEIMGVIFDIMLWSRTDEHYVCDTEEGKMVFPHHILDEMGTFEFKGREYPCPKNLDEWAETRYGPLWHIPRINKGPWVNDTFNIQ